MKRQELKRITSSFPRNELCSKRLMTRLKLSVCPTCGKKNLKKVRRTVNVTRHGKRFSVPAVEFYECSDCGERIYDPTAMRQIEERSQAAIRNKSVKKIA